MSWSLLVRFISFRDKTCIFDTLRCHSPFQDNNRLPVVRFLPHCDYNPLSFPLESLYIASRKICSWKSMLQTTSLQPTFWLTVHGFKIYYRKYLKKSMPFAQCRLPSYRDCNSSVGHSIRRDLWPKYRSYWENCVMLNLFIIVEVILRWQSWTICFGSSPLSVEFPWHILFKFQSQKASDAIWLRHIEHC